MAMRRVVPLLRTVLVLAFLAVLVLQLLSIPGELAQAVEEEPRFSTERWVLLVVAEVELLCVQVVVVAMWRLLGMVQADRIFSQDAFRWVDLVLGAIAVAWVVWVGLGIFVVTTSDDPGNPLAVGIVGLAITVVGLLMLVMRALLQQATALRSDMDMVI